MGRAFVAPMVGVPRPQNVRNEGRREAHMSRHERDSDGEVSRGGIGSLMLAADMRVSQPDLGIEYFGGNEFVNPNSRASPCESIGLVDRPPLEDSGRCPPSLACDA